MEIKFADVEKLDNLIDELTPEDREELAARIFKKLSVEQRSRVLGLSDAGLTVVIGSFVSLNSEIAVNIQNSNSSFDPEAVVLALLDYQRQQRQQQK